MKYIIRSFLIMGIFLITQNSIAIKVSNEVKPVSYYVNRPEEINAIENILGTFRRISLVGISGIGKTQLTRRYTTINNEKYDLIWIFDCNADLLPQFVNLAQSINANLIGNSQIRLAEGINEAQKDVLDYLKSKDRFLLIIDNLKINTNRRGNIFLEWENSGHIIFCSQDADLLPNVINISYLSPDAAEELIYGILPNFSSDFITRLAKELKGYPISTAKSAIFLDANNYITFEEYETYLKGSSDDMDVYVDILLNQLNDSTKKLLYQLVFLNNQNLSKSLIKKLSNKDTFIDDLVNLNRYQILSLKSNKDNIKIFELHDRLKNAIISKMDKKLFKQSLITSVDNVNNFIPKGKNTKQQLILTDTTMVSNIEELLIHAEKNKIDIIKILELKKNLMSFYLGMGVTRCQEFIEWLAENKEKILRKDDNKHVKALYAEFLILVGVYDYFINADYMSAMKNLHDAEGIINKLTNYDDLKYMVYSQLAQAYVHNAEMEKTILYIEKARMIDTEVIGMGLDATLLKYIEAKYYLSQGEYNKALEAINGLIEIIKDFPIDYYFAPIYVMKAMILNYQGHHNEAYRIVKTIYDKEINEISSGNAGGVRLRVIIELSRAELGLNLKQESLRHANQAIDIYKNDQSRKNFDLNTSIDVDLADAFIAQGDALYRLKKSQEAIHSYSIAEAIYYNKYQQKISKLDEISCLYKKAVEAAYSVEDKYSFNKFKKRHLEKFGLEHFRSKEMLSFPEI